MRSGIFHFTFCSFTALYNYLPPVEPEVKNVEHLRLLNRKFRPRVRPSGETQERRKTRRTFRATLVHPFLLKLGLARQAVGNLEAVSPVRGFHVLHGLPVLDVRRARDQK